MTLHPNFHVSFFGTPGCCLADRDETLSDLYIKEFSFVGSDGKNDKATYFASTSNYTIDATALDGKFPVVEYTRSSEDAYDLIYYETDAIIDPFDYVNGTKRFYMDVFSTAPPCTHVLLQLDSLPLAEAEYPIGRHSRFIAFTNSTFEWERLQFDFLDFPDEGMDLNQTSVNSLVLFFDPGSHANDTYYFHSLDSAIVGCDASTEDCEEDVSNLCLATIIGDSCTDIFDSWDANTTCAEIVGMLMESGMSL